MEYSEDFEKTILDKVRSEYEAGFSFVSNKRTRIDDRYEIYNNIADQDKKIYDRLIKTIVKVQKALHGKKDLEVDFLHVGNYDSYDLKLLQALAERDFVKTKRARKNKLKIETTAIVGCSIELQSWNKDRVDNILVDPRTWIPDPNYSLNFGYGFHGFELEATKEELSYSGFYNIDEIRSKADINIEKTIDQKIKKGTDRRNKEVQRLRDLQPVSDFNIYPIYMHFTRDKGVPYKVLTANDRGMVLSIEEILPVTKEQEANPMEIEFPVTVTYFSDNIDDVFGESIFDILEDKQRMRQIFMNLNYLKAKAEAGFDTYFVDESALTNINDLLNPNENGPTYVGYDSRISPDPVKVQQRNNIKQDSYNMPDLLKNEAFYNSGQDTSSVGVSAGAGVTATENVRNQKNANLMTMFTETYIADAEEDFWMRWLEIYARNIESSIDVTVTVSGIYKKGTITKEKIQKIINNVIVRAKTRDIDKKEEKKQFLTMYGSMFYQTAQTQFTKYNILKNIGECYGLDDYFLEEILEEPYELIKGKMDVELINNGQKPDDIDLNEDHLAFLTILRQADDSKLKHEAITKRLLAYVDTKKAPTQEQGGTNPLQQMSNIATNVSTNKSMEGQAPSLQDNTA